MREKMFSGNVNGHQYSAKLTKLAYSNNALMINFSNFIYKTPKNLAFVGDYVEPGNVLTGSVVTIRFDLKAKQVRCECGLALRSFSVEENKAIQQQKKELGWEQ